MKQPRFTEQQIDFILRHADVDNDAGAEASVAVEPVPDTPGPATANGTPTDTGAALNAATETKPAQKVAAAAEVSAAAYAASFAYEVAALEAASTHADTAPVAFGAPAPEAVSAAEEIAPVAFDTPATVEASAPSDIAPIPSHSARPEQAPAPAEISPATFDLYRKKYAGLSVEEMSRLQMLEDENSRLRLLIARLIVEKGPHAPVTDEEASDPPMPSFMSGASRANFAGTEPQMPDFDAGEPMAIALTAEDERANAIDAARQSAMRAAEKVEETWTHARASAARLVVRARKLQSPLTAASRAATLAKTAIRRAPNIRRHLSWSEARRVIAGTAKIARQKSKGRGILLAGIAAGLVAGFAVGIESSPLDESEMASLPVDTSVRLNSYSSVSSMMEKGWEKPQPWGTWMSANDASVVFGFDGPSRGDVELLIEGRTQPLQGVDPPTVIVRFNDAELGRWRLPAQASPLRRRFIIPAAVFNRSTEGRLSFAVQSAAATSSVFGIQALSLRDVRLLANFKGFLDVCTPDKLAGWAMADGAPVSVTANVNGKPIAAQMSNLERHDLAERGLPKDAGFELKPETPIPAGSKVEVQFANGRPLRGSPCKP